MNLHIDGLEKYYKPDPIIIHHKVNYHYRKSNYDNFANKLKKSIPDLKHITLNINPFRVDDPKDLMDPSNKVYLGNL